MQPKRIQLYLLIGVSAITLHFSILLGGAILDYQALNRKASARIAQWEIAPVKKRFAIKADYTFEAEEKTCTGSTTLKPPYFLSEEAAFIELKKIAKETWTVYYKEQDPGISSLEKIFPFSLLFRTVCCLGVLVYFFVLRRKIISNKILLSSYK